MNPFEYYLLDVFTSEVFSGNQLAVFPDASKIDPSLYQKIAREFNLSETVFLFPPRDDEHHSMRIFTPFKELSTAGHPTIGTSFLLARASQLKEITIHQKIGKVNVSIEYVEGEPDLITMHQSLPVFGSIQTDIESIAEMLSLKGTDIEDLPIQEVSCGNNILIIPLKRADILNQIKVRIDVLEKLANKMDVTQLYCFSTHQVTDGDVQGRMFAPLLGIYEDPATGSANGPLACYLSQYKVLQMPAKSLQGYEMGRPSQLHLDIQLNNKNEISGVKVGGKCKLVGKGELFLGA